MNILKRHVWLFVLPIIWFGQLASPEAYGASASLIPSPPVIVNGSQQDNGCALSGLGYEAIWSCSEPGSPGRVWHEATLSIPSHVQYISFDFTFSGLEAEDTAVVFLDGRLVWSLAGNRSENGVQRGSGRVPVTSEAGERRLMVGLYGRGTSGGTFKLSGLTLERYDGTALSAATLPVSRSVQVGDVATVFGTISNGGAVMGNSCEITLKSAIPAAFNYQITDPATNALLGSANQPVDIPPAGSQSFVLAIIPYASFPPEELEFGFACTNSDEAPIRTSLSTVLMSASDEPVSDVIALGATLTGDQVLWLPGSNGNGFFGVAGANVGAEGDVTVAMDTGDTTLPLDITVCQQDPDTAVCLAPPAQEVTVAMGEDTTVSFAVFVTATGAISFDPANHRIFVRIKDSEGVVRGATSVAVSTSEDT